MPEKTEVYVSTVDACEYEPYMLENEQVGEVHWLRTESGGTGELFAGLWTCEPREFRNIFAFDETLHVLEGEAHIELEEGGAVDLHAGDIASFTKGQVSTWTVVKPFKKFFVASS